MQHHQTASGKQQAAAKTPNCGRSKAPSAREEYASSKHGKARKDEEAIHSKKKQRLNSTYKYNDHAATATAETTNCNCYGYCRDYRLQLPLLMLLLMLLPLLLNAKS